MWPRYIRNTHKWLSAIVGIQLVIWMLSGLYMVSIDIDVIHGDHLVKTSPKRYLSDQLSPIPTQYNQLKRVSLTHQLGQAVYIINSESKSFVLNAATAKPIFVDKDYITNRALETYNESGALLDVTLLSAYPSELGGRKSPLWRATFDDDFSPTLYFSASTAQFVKARSDLWRGFDWMWRLHIMDYDDGENVNNLLLTFATLLALLVASSGAWLIFYSFGQSGSATGFLAVLRLVHKWLAIFVGLQFLLWVVSGLFFNIVTSEQLNQRHLLQAQPLKSFSANVVDFSSVIKRLPQSTQLRIERTVTLPVVYINDQNNALPLQLKTLTAVKLSQAQAKDIAQRVFNSDANIDQIIEVGSVHVESRRHPQPLWRVSYLDQQHSALYIDAFTGKVIDLKTDIWRLKDIFWMLHIMDYRQRSDFNHWLVITLTSLASLMAISGFLMLFWVIGKGHSRRAQQHKITINSKHGHRETLTVDGAQPLLHALRQQGHELPSGCDGNGTCGQCIIKGINFQSSLSAQEQTTLSMQEMNQGCRLACQTQVTSDLTIEITDQAMAQQKIVADVISNEFVTPFIKELIIRLPYNSSFSFAAGQFVNFDIPVFNISLSSLNVPAQYQPYWQQQQLSRHVVSSMSRINRSYSLANSPQLRGQLSFNIKLALPQGGYGPGVASSYLMHLNAGDSVTINGPLGDFVTDNASRKEMILIGAGAGMAPLKALADDVVNNSYRTVSLWFGARQQDDIFYQSHFDALARRKANFSWHVSLSQPVGNDWRGAVGHIQRHLFDSYLNAHHNIGDCEFYLCGPAPMMRDVSRLLVSRGVPAQQIKCDDFG